MIFCILILYFSRKKKKCRKQFNHFSLVLHHCIPFLSHTHTLPPILSDTHTLSHTHTHSLTHTPSLSLSHSHPHSLSLSLSIYISLSFSLTHSLSHLSFCNKKSVSSCLKLKVHQFWLQFKFDSRQIQWDTHRLRHLVVFQQKQAKNCFLS